MGETLILLPHLVSMSSCISPPSNAKHESYLSSLEIIGSNECLRYCLVSKERESWRYLIFISITLELILSNFKGNI